jgi:SOS-response transcriptional repressor LexA
MSERISTRGDLRRDGIVQYVTDYWTVHGYAPTFREIARGCGYRSAGSVAYQVTLLEEAGVMAHTPGIARSLRVVER